MHPASCLIVIALCAQMGCSGAEVIPGNNSDEADVIRAAHDHLLETNAIDGTYQYEAYIRQPSFRPGSGSSAPKRPQDRSSWTVKFTFYDAFGAPAGQASVLVRRYGTPGNLYYEAGPQ